MGRRTGSFAAGLAAAALTLHASGCGSAPEAPPGPDLLLAGGRIWTGGDEPPFAGWISIRGDRIESVERGEAAPPAQHTLYLGGRLVVPGFNDSHVHFAQAGELLLGANLLDASSDPVFRDRIAQAAARLPAGSWITGGDWGAYEAWQAGSDGKRRGRTSYVPRRELIDEVTARHPVLVTRFDGKMGLANGAALSHLRIDSRTGILEGEALAAAIAKIPPKSAERRLAEARRALLECRRWGVTSVQDMSPLDQVDLYERLRAQGELTARIHFSPSRLSDVAMMKDKAWVTGAGDEWIRFGTIKSHVDGIMGARTARFFEPYADNAADQASWRGGWREFSQDLNGFERMLTEADAAGIQLRVHAIGDEANAILLDILDRIEAANGARDRRFRLVHAQVIRAADFPRLAGRGVVAEVQPFHCADDMRWMEERIGAERSRGAYAFRSLMEAGCVLAFGSDWPGTNASYYPVNPLLGVYSAVTRQTLKGTPSEGWYPEQRIGLERALKAYTWGGAYASYEESLKGTIEPGKLADIAVLDTDLFSEPPRRWLEARVDHTIVGGVLVYARAEDPEAESPTYP